MAENIIIFPGQSKFEFVDSGSTNSFWTFVSSGTGLRFSNDTYTILDIVDKNKIYFGRLKKAIDLESASKKRKVPTGVK